MEQNVAKQSDGKFRFTISYLLALTAFVALHIKVPFLFQALIATVLSGFLLGLLMWGALYAVLAFKTGVPFYSVVYTDHPIIDRWARKLTWMLIVLYLAFAGLFAYASP